MLTIEVLSKAHDRANFNCGNDELNFYLQHVARQHLSKGIAKTFVLIDDQVPAGIIAYMTLMACEILASEDLIGISFSLPPSNRISAY